MTTRTRARWQVALLTVAAITLGGGAGEAAACPGYQLAPALLGDQTAVAADGGLVVTQVRGQGPGLAGLAVSVRGDAGGAHADWLAPGLERWRAPAGAILDLQHGPTCRALTVMPAGRRLRAPVIRVARSTTPRPPDGPALRHGGPYATLTLETGPAPAGAVALIVYGPTRDAAGIAWTRVTAGATTFSIGGGGKRCGGGAGPVYARDRVSLAWLDEQGRLSARSPLRRVTLAPVRD